MHTHSSATPSIVTAGGGSFSRAVVKAADTVSLQQSGVPSPVILSPDRVWSLAWECMP